MPLDILPVAVVNYLNATRAPRIQEIVRVAWQYGSNIKHYSSTAVNEVPGFTNLSSVGITNVEPRFQAAQFLDIPLSAGFSDDVISLDFWDADDEISNLYRLSGEGTKVTVFYFLPEVSPPYLAEYFWGILRTPQEADQERFKIDVTEGFGSPSVQIPKRVIYAGCQATFGGLVNPETGQPYFTTQAQIDENDCPYNRHLAGGGDFGVPGFTSCPKRNRQDCIDRLGDDYSYLAFDVLTETVRFGKNNRFVATTHANESAANQPMNVIYGYRHVSPMTLLAYRNETSSGGTIVTMAAVCEGEVEEIFAIGMNAEYTPYEHHEIRLGAKRQPRISYTGNIPTNSNFSGTAVVRQTVFTKNNWTPENIVVHGFVKGKKVRVYTTPTAYTVKYSNNRAWCLLDMLTNRRYGLGYAHSRFQIQDFIDVATWSEQNVTSINEKGQVISATTLPQLDPETGDPIAVFGGNSVNGISAWRTRLDVNIKGEDARQIIRDWCLAGRYGLPFHFNGKIRLVGLRDESVTAPYYFRDYGTARNILWENGKSTLRWSFKNDEELVNQVKVKFDNEAEGYMWAEHPILFGDEHQQLAAGKRFGDDTKRVLEKEYFLFGVTRFHEAVRVAKMLLDLGEFDEGGLENNLEVKFKTWFPTVEALKLHKYAIIAVEDPKVNAFRERTSGQPFLYFRIKKIRRLPNLTCEITAQAYPAAYYAAVEMGVILNVGVITAPSSPVIITGGIPQRPQLEKVNRPSRNRDSITVRVGD